MITVLVDHNIEGQAALLWNTLIVAGWVDLAQFRFVTFVQVGLTVASSDRMVWQFAQAQGMLLLTGNRNMDNPNSLEQTIRDSNQATSLPVITVSDLDQMVEATYRERCATRLAEIVLYLDDYRGAGRLFIP
jgi:hypothetical protein